MNTVERRLEIDEYDDGSLPIPGSFLHQLTNGEDLIAASSSGSESCLFLSAGLLPMVLQPGLNYLHEDLADDGEEADATIVLAFPIVAFLVGGHDDGLLNFSI